MNIFTLESHPVDVFSVWRIMRPNRRSSRLIIHVHPPNLHSLRRFASAWRGMCIRCALERSLSSIGANEPSVRRLGTSFGGVAPPRGELKRLINSHHLTNTRRRYRKVCSQIAQMQNPTAEQQIQKRRYNPR